jgi:hypothetical protein
MRSFDFGNIFFAVAMGALPFLVLGCSADSTSSTFGGRIAITSPADGTSVAKPSDNKLTVSFDTNYVLKDPGGCNGQTGCGSVYLLIDGSACNQSGKAWNTFATASPATVDLSLCSMAIGAHSLQAELHQDDAAGSFVENSITHAPVLSKVAFTITP